jgi:heme exporter protein B
MKSDGAVPPSFVRAALAIARKDLAIEFRTRTAFLSALVFALLAIVVFYFAWDASAVATADRAPGVLWVIFIFSGLLALNRAFTMESHDRSLDALLLAPIAREAIFAGKALANLVFVLGVQVIAIPAVFVFYNVPGSGAIVSIAIVAVLAAIGLVAVGTLFSAMAANTRLAELLLPMLALPFFVPIIIPAAQVSWRVLTGRPLSEVLGWLQVLAAFDIVFVTACTLVFPHTLEE